MIGDLLLEAKGISLSVGQRVLATNLSLSVFEGERVGIYGVNGAGKTTLFRALLGLHAIRAGSILLDGRPLSSFSVRARSQLYGYVPQQAGVLPSLSIGDFYNSLLFVRGAHIFQDCSMRNARVQRVLEEIGLSNREHELLPHLSGGELKRIFIGAAFLLPSKLLLLDEPAASLDPEAEEAVFRYLLKTLEDNPRMGLLLISHDQQRLFQMCNRVYEFTNGGLVLTSTADGSPLKEQA